MASKLSLVVVAAFVLTGCAQAQTTRPGAAAACNASARECNVTISVGSNCVPVPSVDPLPVPAGISPAVINWRIDPASVQAGATFVPGTGIVVHDDAAQQFSPVAAQSPIHVHVTDRNTNRTTYKYAINVRRNGAACPTLDPSIINGQ